MTEAARGGIVSPAAILAGARNDSAIRQLAEKIQRPNTDTGTPFAKTRIGFISAVDYTTWTCTAYFTDLTSPIPGIPMIGEVAAVASAQGVFTQVGNQYTLIGILTRGASRVAVVKAAIQSRVSSTALTLDNHLKFWALSDRTYIFEATLFVHRSTIDAANPDVDIDVGLNIPTGATTSFGGPRMDPAATLGSFLGSGDWGVRLNGITNAVLRYGVVNSATPTIVTARGSILMGPTAGLVTVVWNPSLNALTTLNVNAGSYLTAEIAL